MCSMHLIYPRAELSRERKDDYTGNRGRRQSIYWPDSIADSLWSVAGKAFLPLRVIFLFFPHLGRPSLAPFRAAPSKWHQCLKFAPEPGRQHRIAGLERSFEAAEARFAESSYFALDDSVRSLPLLSSAGMGRAEAVGCDCPDSA